MATATRNVSSQFAPVSTEPNLSLASLSIDTDLIPIPVASLPPELRTLTSHLPFIVMVPKYVVCNGTIPRTLREYKSAIDAGSSASGIHSEGAAGDAIFVFGEVTVSFPAMEARRNGKLLALTLKEFKILAYMSQNAGRVISREELLNEVWGYDCYPCTRTVDNHILRLRQKLEIEPAHPRHFQTVHSAGYKFLP
jgi:hypothetical protein